MFLDIVPIAETQLAQLREPPTITINPLLHSLIANNIRRKLNVR